MQPHIFTPDSVAFVKNKAKQFQRAFPGLSLATAQNATAIALGYQSWFDCKKRLDGSNISRPVYDEELSHSDRIERRHHQFCSLVDNAPIAPVDAEHFIRVWNLTSTSPATLLSEFETPFHELKSALTRYQSNPKQWEDINYKGEDIDPPKNITDGVILGGFPDLKYPYYALDSKRLESIPLGIRGNASMFLEFEEGHLIRHLLGNEIAGKSGGVNDFIEIKEEYPYQYQWLTGGNFNIHDTLPDYYELLEDATDNPMDWYALSFRQEISGRELPTKETYIPALKGNEFAEYLRNKGALKFKNVTWFRLRDDKHILDFMPPFDSDKISWLKLTPDHIEPCKPVYHSPFKHGPMKDVEYLLGMEGSGMFLDQELEEDELDMVEL